MSGRSAYVRKKITETKGPASVRGRARSIASSEHDDVTISDFPLPTSVNLKVAATGVGTSNARFLKFSEPVLRENDGCAPPGSSSNSQSGGSIDGSHRRPYGDSNSSGQYSGPLDDFAYARARRPAIKTEDVSGIEKSGFRSALDKKSEGMRKGLAKTFAWKKKKPDTIKAPEFRPESSATMRAGGAVDQAFSPVDGYGSADQPFDQQRHQQWIQQQQEQRDHQNSQNKHVPRPLLPVFNEPWDPSDSFASPPPSAKLPPVPGHQTPPIRRWCGNGKPVQRWNKLRKDPELWDPNGDVLVYLVHRGAQPRPNASFRLSSHIIEATESRHLITMLREGSTEDSDAYGSALPPSPIGAPPMLNSRRGGHVPNSPISDDPSFITDQDGQISYEMYFPPPTNMTKMDQVRYHITTRNVFALLYHASLVGLGLYQALTDLQQRLEQYLPVPSDSLGTLIHYLCSRGLDDTRNDPDTAAALLAWSEAPEVRWDEGWRESFCHAAGMFGPGLELAPDFKNVSPMTRALLERANLETSLRIQAAEERLVAFDYSDMWPPVLASSTNAARAAADRLQTFLKQFYSRSYGNWPPIPSSQASSTDGLASPISPGAANDESWLSRQIAQDLQSDFGALYDYLVNREIVFDGSETRSSRKWIMVYRSTCSPANMDTSDLPLTDMLIEWDNRFRFPHIPSPMPLVPESILPLPAAQIPKTGKSKDKDKDKEKEKLLANKANSAQERRVQFAYNEATNIHALSMSSASVRGRASTFVDEFIKFEKRDRPLEVDPSIARRGRWILIYGILQTLASISVDAPAVRYKDGVSYHLSLRLKGQRVPPWRNHIKSGGKDEMLDANHELSHCWMAPMTWDEVTQDDDVDDRGYGPRGLAFSQANSQAQRENAPSRIGTYMSPRPGVYMTNHGHLSIAGSVMSSSGYSESDTASSIRTPTTPFSTRARSRDGRISSNQYRGGYGATYGGGPGRVDEEWIGDGIISESSFLNQGLVPGSQPRGRRPHGGTEEYLGRGSSQRESMVIGSMTAEVPSKHVTQNQESNSNGVGPLIRDFDVLDVIDDHEP